MSPILEQIDSLGRFFTRNIEYTARVFVMTYLTLRATLLDKSQGFRQIIGVISSQIYFTGWQALPLVSVLALAVGAVFILQSTANLSIFGGTQMIGQFLTLMILREAGPLMVALVVIARSGTAVASEVGNMRANREIEALESIGINPLSYIVFPRVVGGILSVLGLAFYFNVIAFFGGYVLTMFIHDLPFTFYLDSLAQGLNQTDIILFVAKNGFSGMIIFVVSCFQGLQVKRSPHEVPQVTTTAVVHSIIFVVIFNLIVSGLIYANQLKNFGVGL